MKPRVVAAIDQGTTSSRCILFDQEGGVVSMHQLEHRQIYPRPGWVEHDPEEIWDKTAEVIRAAIAKANLAPGEIAAVG
ncbi:MAG TPA: FGGY family carbohydrate kinase, partial [Vicinamibacteria bacterium]|nr:FGGY family carbohydrate kinase [Vicinamibacteria bacterium]